MADTMHVIKSRRSTVWWSSKTRQQAIGPSTGGDAPVPSALWLFFRFPFENLGAAGDGGMIVN